MHKKRIFHEILNNYPFFKSDSFDVNKELIFSDDELVKFFSINKSKEGEFKFLLRKHSNSYNEISLNINNNTYFSLPKLINCWELINLIIPLTIFYVPHHQKKESSLND
jgi:hypothetical protein